MSKPALEALKKRFQEQKEQSKTGGTKFNNDYYPFWQMNTDETAVVRILPIKNQEAMPFLEKDHHKISIDGKDQNIPCAAMYGETCPLCELSRKFYKIAKSEKDPEKKADAEKKGKYYYRSRSFLASAYVKKDPLPPNSETNENFEGKTAVVQFGNQLYKKFDASLETLVKNEEIDDVPWDLTNGLDFNIVKKMGSTWAEWDLSSDFARRTSSLPQDFVDNFEPVDLRKFLPENFGEDKIQRMLDAHLNNSTYEEETGNNSDSIETSMTVDETVTETSDPEVNMTVTEVNEPESDEGEDEIQAMLRQLKNRTSQS